MTLKSLFLGVVAFACGSAAFAATVAVEAPNGHLKLTLEVAADGAVTHSLALDGKPLISPSPVGFGGWRFACVTRRAENSVWKPVWGKRAVVPDGGTTKVRHGGEVVDLTIPAGGLPRLGADLKPL